MIPFSSSHAATSLDSLDVEWMFEHSKQARRMMPGGVTVIGAFFVSSAAAEDVFRSAKGVAKCRELLSSLRAHNDAAKEIPLDDGLLLVHIQGGNSTDSGRFIGPLFGPQLGQLGLLFRPLFALLN